MKKLRKLKKMCNQRKHFGKPEKWRTKIIGDEDRRTKTLDFIGDNANSRANTYRDVAGHMGTEPDTLELLEHSNKEKQAHAHPILLA
jgi:hypothetical protein